MVNKCMNTTVWILSFTLEKIWSLLVEVGVRRVAACELFCSDGRKVSIWNLRSSCNSRCGWVWLIPHKVTGGSWEMLEVCVPVLLLLALFCDHLEFLPDRIPQKQAWNLEFSMLKMFPNKSVVLEQMCVFQTSIISDWLSIIWLRDVEITQPARGWYFMLKCDWLLSENFLHLVPEIVSHSLPS